MEADEDNIIIIILNQEVKRQYENGKTKLTKKITQLKMTWHTYVADDDNMC